MQKYESLNKIIKIVCKNLQKVNKESKENRRETGVYINWETSK